MRKLAGSALGVALMLAGCSSVVDGNAEFALPVTDPKALAAILLSPEDISAVMGGSMSTSGTKTDFVRTRALDDTRCQNPWAPADDWSYDGTPTTGVQVRTLQSADTAGPELRLVSEALITFSDIYAADAFIADSLATWKLCQNRAITITPPTGEPPSTWTFGPAGVDQDHGTMTISRTSADGAVCQRVMAVRANVIVDVAACGYGVKDQGAQIADKLVAKIRVTK